MFLEQISTLEIDDVASNVYISVSAYYKYDYTNHPKSSTT